MFPACPKTNFCISFTFILLSNYGFNLDRSTILPLGKKSKEPKYSKYCNHNQDPPSIIIQFPFLTLSQTISFRRFRTKEFTEDNFEFDENDRKFSKWVENTEGKGEIARYKQLFLFTLCFQKTFTTDT